MFPLSGPEIIKWLLDPCARPGDRLNPGFMDRFISGSDTDNESSQYGAFTQEEENECVADHEPGRERCYRLSAFTVSEGRKACGFI